MGQINKINANPTKKFYIDMLIRDIALEPAIAELVDNSLDGVRMLRQRNYTGQCSINVEFNENYFSIKDSCGGISIKDAKDYCFRFGRDENRSFELNNGTGVFGIGMKRALFRMGKDFEIISYTKTEHFKIHIDVDNWLLDNDENWTFSFDEVNDSENNPIEKCGTTIRITKLHNTISHTFSDPKFKNSFLNYIKQRCSMIEKLNVTVSINNNIIQYSDEKILFNDRFKPYVKNVKLDNVKVTIIACLAEMGEPKKAGWYIQCNGRTVMFANQGAETGWGTGNIPAFHSKYATFRGYVLFESSDLEKLPWNTTKTGVDLSSKYYIMALEIMQDCEMKYTGWIAKVDDLVDSNDNLEKKALFDGEVENIFSTKLMDYAKQDNYSWLPELSSDNFPIPEEPKTTISFKVVKHLVEQIKNNMNDTKMSNKTLGELIFNYYYEREISDE